MVKAMAIIVNWDMLNEMNIKKECDWWNESGSWFQCEAWWNEQLVILDGERWQQQMNTNQFMNVRWLDGSKNFIWCDRDKFISRIQYKNVKSLPGRPSTPGWPLRPAVPGSPSGPFRPGRPRSPADPVLPFSPTSINAKQMINRRK